jgi:hypothetical protein
MTSTRTATRFNDVVQHDLLFANGDQVKKHQLQSKETRSASSKDDTPALRLQMGNPSTLKEKVPWQHMIGVATRWSQATVLTGKTTDDILSNAIKICFAPYGAPRVLETDQESAWISYEAKAVLQKLGTQMEERPKHGHAPIVERHHTILRETYLKIKQQADEEGVSYTMERVLTMAVVAKNALTNIGGYMPQQAVFGTQSALLSDMSQGDAAMEDERSTHRLREIALQSLLQTH